MAFNSLFGLLLILLPSLLFSVETMDTALQVAPGNVRAVLYYADTPFKPALFTDGQDVIKVRVGTGEISYLGYTGQTVNCNSQSRSTVLKVISNPFGGLSWWAKIGSGGYSLEIPSSTVTNRLDGTSPGIIVGVGARYRLMPDTIVTPGICLDFSATRSEYSLNRFFDGTNTAAVRNRFEVNETQMTFLISKSKYRNTGIEPYGGLSFFRYFNVLTDEESLVQVSGFTDNVELFAGARIRMYPLEWFIFECRYQESLKLSLGLGWGW